MEKGQRLYGWGTMFILVAIVLSGIIWLPDPLRFGEWFWMDSVQILVGLVLPAVPLLWLAGALWGMWRDKAGKGQLLVRLGVAAGSLATSILLWMQAYDAWTIVLAVAGWVLTVIDTGWSESRSLAANRTSPKTALSNRRWPRRTLIKTGITLALLVILLWPTPYLVTFPGMTINMNRYAAVEGGSPKGTIQGVLVMERPAVLMDWVLARLFPHYEFEPRQNLGMSLGEYETMVRIMKADADAISTAIALQKAGLGRGILADGVAIVRILPDSPARDVLAPGDIIVGVNGQPVLSYSALSEAMAGVTPGDPVQLSIRRNDGDPIALAVPTMASADDPKRAVFGIQVEDSFQADITRSVEYRPYIAHIGGPSHGAILALALLDQLTPGGVTHGNRVAGTGTLEPDGTVGPIGGIRQKAYVVERAGADVFFVPEGQEQEARQAAGSLNIVPVRTLDDMLEWLKQHPK